MKNPPAMRRHRKTTHTKRSIPSLVVSRRIRTAALRLIGILTVTALASGLTNTAKAAEQGKPAADSADARRELLMKKSLSQPFKNDRTMLYTLPLPAAPTDEPVVPNHESELQHQHHFSLRHSARRAQDDELGDLTNSDHLLTPSCTHLNP